MTHTNENDKIRIYVACLAAYNNGFLHGKWIDANQDEDAIIEEINAMLDDSPIPSAEEFAIHDHEGFGPAPIGEYESVARIADIAAFIGKYGDLAQALLGYYSGDLDAATRMIEDAYLGAYKSAADYAEAFIEETGGVPDHLACYIDYEAMARDMTLNGDIIAIETGFEAVHIFIGH